MRWFLSVFLIIGVLAGSSLVLTSAQEGTPPATPLEITPEHVADLASTPAATPEIGAPDVATPEHVVPIAAAEGTPAAATPVAVTPTTPSTPLQGATPAATPVGDEVTGVIFVQSAPNSTITPLLDATSGATHELALIGGGNVDQAAYFGDRPSRAVGTVPHTDVMGVIGTESDNPPTAVLVAQTRDGGEEIVVVEIISGAVHVTGDLVYRVTLLADDTNLDLELEAEPVREITDIQNYETSYLFIFVDDLCHPGRPC